VKPAELSGTKEGISERKNYSLKQTIRTEISVTYIEA
jgi:hypothetical protein